MKLKYTFETVDMGEETICVPVGKGAAEVHGVLKLNAEGREILERMKEEITEEAIVDTLAAKYENDRAVLAAYVRNVVDSLRSAGLIAE